MIVTIDGPAGAGKSTVAQRLAGRLRFRYLDTRGRVFIAGADVTSAIRRSSIDRVVPVVARHPQVRRVMRERQRELAAEGDAVVEGRDIGTAVAPDAGGN